MPSVRRLAAIMFTDIAGYTSLAQANEALALAVLERHHDLLRPLFDRFRGRVVKTMGDAFLVEFESALEATDCAIEVQRAVHEHNLAASSDWRFQVRIGLHLGDVTRTSDDILGNAVNIASRIEHLADPGGICLSEQVFAQVRNGVNLPIVKLDPQGLRHVDLPIDVYRVAQPWETERPGDHQLAKGHARRLAVLPFVNMSSDTQDEYFADGLTEEMITELSRLPTVRVIARSSVVRFKGAPQGVLAIGKELGVGTVLEGSVRKAANRIRITTQLIDARTEEHLWSETFDREFRDVFEIQTEISRHVANALHLRLAPPPDLVPSPTQNLDAYALYLKGRTLWNNRSPTSVREALRCFEQARDKDSRYPQAYSGIADCWSILADAGEVPWSEVGPTALAAARKAVGLDDRLASAHASLGLALMRNYDWDEAEREFRRAIAISPGYSMAHHWYYMLLMTQRRSREAMLELSRAEDSDPLSPTIILHTGFVEWLNRRDDEALRKVDRVLELDSRFELAHVNKVYINAYRGRIEEAMAAFRAFESLDPGKQRTNVWYGFLLGLLGKRHEAEEWVSTQVARSKESFVHPMAIAWTYGALGDADSFFEWLFRATDDIRGGVFSVVTYPCFDKVRADPRFREYLRRCHLAT